MAKRAAKKKVAAKPRTTKRKPTTTRRTRSPRRGPVEDIPTISPSELRSFASPAAAQSSTSIVSSASSAPQSLLEDSHFIVVRGRGNGRAEPDDSYISFDTGTYEGALASAKESAKDQLEGDDDGPENAEFVIYRAIAIVRPRKPEQVSDCDVIGGDLSSPA